jgi:hypothetical protein
VGTVRRLVTVAFVTALAAAAVASPAAADSLAFIKNDNVWLAQPDGSGQYQVTLDGTPAAPYESPSQSDGGTVVAIRQAPGQRRQIYRMTQSGGLLNPPINTPAPGTGALNAKVSPNGALVAYWFVTTVNDPLCAFCVNVANRVLLSRSDRFTGADEVGTPNGGGFPSWLGDDTIVLGDGSATQWYYKLGMPEMAEWFNDGLFTGSGFQTLLDAEAAPTADRVAVVRGNNQETIRFLTMSGAPPAAPTPVGCGFEGPSGSFVDPTWTSDGRRLAWQENDGVWLGSPGDLTCPMPAPALVVAGGRQPDLSPAALNPGPRPACGNPGNPTACPTGSSPSTSQPGTQQTPSQQQAGQTLAARLTALLAAGKRALARQKIRGLLRKRQFVAAFDAPGAGTLTVALTAGRTVLASGRRTFTNAGQASITAKLTRKGARRLRRARRLSATLSARFTPKGGKATGVSGKVALAR